MAIGTLQQALGGVNSQVSENVEKVSLSRRRLNCAFVSTERRPQEIYSCEEHSLIFVVFFLNNF